MKLHEFIAREMGVRQKLALLGLNTLDRQRELDQGMFQRVREAMATAREGGTHKQPYHYHMRVGDTEADITLTLRGTDGRDTHWVARLTIPLDPRLSEQPTAPDWLVALVRKALMTEVDGGAGEEL